MILFIDTHADLITIALKNNKDLYIKTQESEYSHSIYTMPMIKEIFNENKFWASYANTLFVTFFGTIFQMIISVLAAYALSKKRLLFRRGFNFFLVFTMWFSAGVVPQFINYTKTQDFFYKIGIIDDKWLIVIAMGMAAMNIILLRNAFEGVPKEIEEAAIVDGASEMQILTKVYMWYLDLF